LSIPSRVTSPGNTSSGFASLLNTQSRRSSEGESSIPSLDHTANPFRPQPHFTHSQTTSTTNADESARMAAHNRALSIDDNFVETVRYVEDETGLEVVKRGEDLSRQAIGSRRSSSASIH